MSVALRFWGGSRTDHALSRALLRSRDRDPLIGAALVPSGHDRCRVECKWYVTSRYCTPRRGHSVPRPAEGGGAMLTLLRVPF
jgi:hypothetical protein